jgi:Protein of unknown function (DUF1479)
MNHTEMKQFIKANIQDLDGSWERLNKAIELRVQEIEAAKKRGESSIPIVDFQDVVHHSANIDREKIKQAGTLIIKNVFPKAMAEGWNEELVDYLERNDYLGQKVNAQDHYFGNLKNSRPQVYGIYWSRPQIQARQHQNMAHVQNFLNGLWNDNGQFEKGKFLTYADRIRMREPQDTTFGLSTHLDSGSVERWMEPNYRKTYEKILTGNWENYDPFELSARLGVQFVPSPAVCKVFRSFQGWTALTAQGAGDGTLQVIPFVKEAISYLMLRPFLADVPSDDWCGSLQNRAFNVNEKWHAPLLKGLCSLPKLQPGDTAWWHPDVIHAVENKHEGKHYSNVMFIAATPYCKKNKDFIDMQKATFLEGRSSPDFSAEDREVHYQNRATTADLTELGKKAMGLMDWKQLAAPVLR